MYKGGRIIAGLILFAGLILMPFLLNVGTAAAKPEPSLNTAAIQQLSGKTCVESAEFMKTEHMQLLNQWRDAALRDGKTVYVNSQGQSFPISLENSCLKCHSNPQQFCNSCHTYAAVKPYCWSCHNQGVAAK